MGFRRHKRYTEPEYVDFMIQYCEDIWDLTRDLDQNAFFANRRVYTSVSWKLFKMGWAVSNLPRSVFDLYPQVDRKRIIVVSYLIEKAMVDLDGDPDDKFIWTMVQDTVPILFDVLTSLRSFWQKPVEDIPEKGAPQTAPI